MTCLKVTSSVWQSELTAAKVGHDCCCSTGIPWSTHAIVWAADGSLLAGRWFRSMKWKWVFLRGWECKSCLYRLISAAMEIWNSSQDGEKCITLNIVLFQGNNWATFNVMMFHSTSWTLIMEHPSHNLLMLFVIILLLLLCTGTRLSPGGSSPTQV